MNEARRKERRMKKVVSTLQLEQKGVAYYCHAMALEEGKQERKEFVGWWWIEVPQRKTFWPHTQPNSHSHPSLETQNLANQASVQ